MGIGKKICAETLRGLVLVCCVTVLAFVMITKAPIDPLVSYIGPNSTLPAETKEEIADYWGLRDPLPQRFATWAGHALHGDLGESITYQKPVKEVLWERAACSFPLLLSAWVLSGLLGFALGAACGTRPGGILDRITRGLCLTLKCAPTFWVGLLFLTVFAVELGWFPLGMAVPMGKLAADVTVWDRIHHLILPVLTLTVVNISEVVLYTRQKLVEIMDSDFILYARARGETTGQILVRHGLRNIALPAITVHFASFSELFGGMALAETVFSYPGIGSATTAAALNGDVPLLLGTVLFSTVFVFTGNVLANILYGVLDPRMREVHHG